MIEIHHYLSIKRFQALNFFPLRVQDHCDDRDTPDSFVPSSSPESVVGMEISRYPDLSLVKEETPEPVPSPIIPILPSSTGKGKMTCT